MIGGLLMFQAAVAQSESAPTGRRSPRVRSCRPCFCRMGGSSARGSRSAHRFSRTLYVDQHHPRARIPIRGRRRCRSRRSVAPPSCSNLGNGCWWRRGCIGSGCDPYGGEPIRSTSSVMRRRRAPDVVVKGSEILRAKFEESRPWVPDPVPGTPKTFVPGSIRMVRLPRSLFPGYNPFAICNYPTADEMPYWNLRSSFRQADGEDFRCSIADSCIKTGSD